MEVALLHGFNSRSDSSLGEGILAGLFAAAFLGIFFPSAAVGALLPGDALVDTPTAALAICGPALLHMFTKETRFG